LIKIDKTVYDPPAEGDGRRVLVMTLWPRGVSKSRIDVWMKELGTPRETMKKWKSGSISWDELVKEYRKSLSGKEHVLARLAEESRNGTVTLLCVEKDLARCHRSLLKEAIESAGHKTSRN
jgi:uncharacterized protein YeaO (DUF488 family)